MSLVKLALLSLLSISGFAFDYWGFDVNAYEELLRKQHDCRVYVSAITIYKQNASQYDVQMIPLRVQLQGTTYMDTREEIQASFDEYQRLLSESEQALEEVLALYAERECSLLYHDFLCPQLYTGLIAEAGLLGGARAELANAEATYYYQLDVVMNDNRDIEDLENAQQRLSNSEQREQREQESFDQSYERFLDRCIE